MSFPTVVDKHATFQCQSCLKTRKINRIGRFLLPNTDSNPQAHDYKPPAALLVQHERLLAVCKKCQLKQRENRLRLSLRDWSLVSSPVEVVHNGAGAAGVNGSSSSNVNNMNSGGKVQENSTCESHFKKSDCSGKRKANELEDTASTVTRKYSTKKQNNATILIPSVEKVELAARLSAFDSFLFLVSDEDKNNDSNHGRDISSSASTDFDADNSGSYPYKKGSRVNPIATQEGGSDDANIENAQNSGFLEALIKEQVELQLRPVIRVFSGSNFDEERDIIEEQSAIVDSTEESANSLVHANRSQIPNLKDNGSIHNFMEARKTANEFNAGNTNTLTNRTARVEKWHDMVVRSVPGSLEEHRVLSDKLSAFDHFLLLVDIDG